MTSKFGRYEVEFEFDLVNFLGGSASTIALHRMVLLGARFVVFFAAIITVLKFVKTHHKKISWFLGIFIITIGAFTLTGCSTAPSNRVSSSGALVDETRLFKQTYCYNSLVKHRASFNEYRTCAFNNKKLLVPNFDGDVCAPFKKKTEAALFEYRVCEHNHKGDTILSNPFNILREDI